MSVDGLFRTLGSDPSGTSTTQTPPLLDERLAWWCYVPLVVLGVGAVALILAFSLRDNFYDPVLPFVVVLVGTYAWALSRFRLILRDRSLGRGPSGPVDLSALVAGGYSFVVTPPPVLPTFGTRLASPRRSASSPARKVWVRDAQGRQISFVPRRYRSGKVLAAAIAFAVQTTPTLATESAPSRLDRFRNDDLLPADWRMGLARSLAARNPPIGGGWSTVPPPPPPPLLPPAPSTAPRSFGKRPMLVAGIVFVVSAAITVVPLATGVGPRVVHNYYCGRNRHLWTTDANVPFSGPLWNAEQVELPGLAMASHDMGLADATYADPKPFAVERTVWQGPDERVTVEQQHFDTRSDALLHHRNALEGACRNSNTVHRFDSLPGAVLVECTCEKARGVVTRHSRVQVVQGSERFLITVETPQGSPSAAMVASSTKRVLDSGRS